LFRRITAVVALAMMLTLTAASGSPVVHDWLHSHSSDDTNHQCAVVLFSTGLTLALDAIEITPREWASERQPVATFQRIWLISPRYLRQPERGPPIS
jgi:hypothetical protein